MDLNQGRLEVVKHEMARVNVNILGISELKWTGILMSVLCQRAHELLPEIPRGIILESHNALHSCIA